MNRIDAVPEAACIDVGFLLHGGDDHEHRRWHSALFPWNPAGGQSVTKTSKDPSLVVPPSYDTVPHTSFVVTDRDAFSSYEVEAAGDYPRAFYVIYDGFAPQELGTPVVPATIALSFDNALGVAVPGLSAVYRQVDFEDPARAPDLPQRVTFTFDLHFADTSAFAIFTETRSVVLSATRGADAALAAMRLIKQPNPYMRDGPVTWLSTDVRVYQMRPGTFRATITQDNPDPNGVAPHRGDRQPGHTGPVDGPRRTGQPVGDVAGLRPTAG